MYIYHNQIDATGDKRESEERVFEAVEATLAELVEIIKKLANANYTNMLITADHGFIYQNRDSMKAILPVSMWQARRLLTAIGDLCSEGACSPAQASRSFTPELWVLMGILKS